MGTSDEERAIGAPSRLLFVDSHPIVRAGLSQLIAGEVGLTVCGETGDASHALRMIEGAKPDLVVLALSLGSRSGLGLVKDIQVRWPGLPVLCFSMHDERLYAERVLRAGARGYIMKDQAPEEVLAAIRKVLRGEIYLSEKMAGRMVQQFVTGVHPQAASPVERLSDRELEVFELVGHGMSTRGIAQALHLSVKTVEAHKAHIKEKLGLARAEDLLFHAMHWGQERSSERPAPDA